MSKSLVPKNDPGSGVVDAVKTDLVTAGITVATVAGVTLIPVFGWAVGVAGGVYLVYRAAKRGVRNR